MKKLFWILVAALALIACGNKEKEYDLTPEKAVTYADATCVGTPSTPLNLNYSADQDMVGIEKVKAAHSAAPRKLLVGNSIRILIDQHEYDTNGREQR